MDSATPLPAAASALDDSAAWQSLPTRAAPLMMLSHALFACLPAIPLTILAGALLSELGISRWVVALIFVAVLAPAGAWLGHLRWRRTAWKLDALGLQIRRGVLWRSETVVPRSRVQHLDIERGPLERRVRLATLTVHTAGTRQHALRQSGLDDADAVALRDALVPDAGRHDDAL